MPGERNVLTNCLGYGNRGIPQCARTKCTAFATWAYLRRVELNEREITHREARATESERTALELAMCMDVLEKLSRLWDTGEPEDRQGMARSLFSHVVFDLDT